MSGRIVGEDACYWKLNSKVLTDRDFRPNFNKILDDVLKEKQFYEHSGIWFDMCFKPRIKNFLRNFSSFGQKGRRDTRQFLCHCLQDAVDREDLEQMSYLRSRLKAMNWEDAMGVVIRSRHKETVEMERMSLFHLNREAVKITPCFQEQLI